MAVVAGIDRNDQFFLENPFYLENNYKDFFQVVSLIPEQRLDNENGFLKAYIGKLKNDEKEILDNIVGNSIEDKEKILENLFNTTFDIKESMEYLENLFKRDYGKISISKDKQGNYFMNLLGARLNLIKENGKYDFKKTIKEADESELNSFKEKLDIYVQTITDGLKAGEELETEVYEVLDKNLLTTKDKKRGGITKVQAFVKEMQKYNYKDITPSFLEFLKSTIGVYSYLRGLFSEAVKVNYEQKMIDSFGGDLMKLRGDQLTGKNKKPDVIIQAAISGSDKKHYLTFSQKVLSGDHIKLQGSSIANLRRNYYMKEDLLLANMFSYLILNDSFSPNDSNVTKKIQLINNYFSYVLISGLSTDYAIDRAAYLVYTTDTETRLIPISAILELISEGQINIDMSPKRIEGKDEDREKLLGIKDLDKTYIQKINLSKSFKSRRTELQKYFKEMLNRSDVKFKYDLKYYFEDSTGVIDTGSSGNPRKEVSRYLAEQITPLNETRDFKILLENLNNIKQGIILTGKNK